jgi:hypothetical protein
MGYLLLGGLAVLTLLLVSRGLANLSRRAMKLSALAILFILAATALVLFAVSGRFALAAPAGALALWGMRAYLLARQIRANSGGQGKPAATNQAMDRAQALEILGLEAGASNGDIEAAYKILIVKNHPDQGGTDWLAARLNEARSVLLDT